MPDPALLSPLGVQMREALPPGLRDSYDYLAVINACSKEFDRLTATIGGVRAQFFPQTADVLLAAWEFQVKLPMGGLGSPIASRRDAVISRLQKLLGSGEGQQWVQTLNGILGLGWTYAEHDPADGTSPAAGVIRVTVPFPSGSSRFIEAQQQAREATAAHLALEFVSVGGMFTLDQSELDVQEWGA